MHHFKHLSKVSIISAANSFSTSITPGERVSLEEEVSVILVVTIIEGIAGAAVSGTEETSSSSRGGVFIETIVLATREVGLVIIGFGSTTSVGEFWLVITCKPVVARAEDVAGMETGLLVDSS